MNKRTTALADSRPSLMQPDELIDWAYAAESELRRLAAENAYLKTGYDASRLEVESLKHRVDEVGRIARENRSRAVIDLEVQISKLNFAIECYRKDIESLIASLGADRYDSKDWREGSRLERIEWLHDMYQGTKAENLHMLTALADAHEEIDSLKAQLQSTENLHCKSTQKRLAWLWGVEPVRQPMTPENAIRIADGLDQNVQIDPQTSEDEPGGYRSELDELMADAAAILRSQHTRIAELEAMLDAVGAGGVEPLRSSKSNHFVGADKTMGAPSRWLNTI